MTDRTYLVCMRVTDLAKPHVPSEELGCTACGLPVWVSRVRIYDVPKPIMPVCFPCAASTVQNPDVVIPAATRAELHGVGLTDEDIARAKAVAEDMLRRIRGRPDD